MGSLVSQQHHGATAREAQVDLSDPYPQQLVEPASPHTCYAMLTATFVSLAKRTHGLHPIAARWIWSAKGFHVGSADHLLAHELILGWTPAVLDAKPLVTLAEGKKED